MTDDLGRGAYRVDVDNSTANRNLAQTEQSFNKTGAAATTSMTKAGTSVGKLTGDLKTGAMAGVGLGAGLGIATVAAVGISSAIGQFGGALSLASDKAEAASKVNVLFGDSAKIVIDASKDAAATMGLSSAAYLKAAGDLGNLTTNFGFTGPAAAKMSVDMLKLAADMGSFNNASTEEVTYAMGAAFRGESEPIRRFGVMLSESAVKAKALELGLYSGKGALDANAKATATYQLILDQTSAAQGDFARTSDGMANSQRINAAKMEDAWTRVGDAIMPLALEVMPVLADAMVGVVDGIGAAIEMLKQMGGALDETSAAIGKFWDDAKASSDEGGRAVLEGIENFKFDPSELGASLREGIIVMIDGLDGTLTPGFRTAAQKAVDAATTEVEHLKGSIDWAGMAPAVAAGAKTAITDPTAAAAKAAKQKAVAQALATPAAIAQALIDGQFNVENAWADIAKIAEQSLTATEERAGIEGFLQSKKLRDGLASGEPAVVAVWQAYKDKAIHRMAELQAEAQEKGGTTGARYAAGIASKGGAVGTAASRLTSPARAKMNDLRADARGYGDRTGDAYAAGLRLALSQGVAPVVAVMTGYRTALAAGSPPLPGAALYGIDKWGASTGKAFVDPMVSELAQGARRVRDALSGARDALTMPPGRGIGLSIAPGITGAAVPPGGASSFAMGDVIVHMSIGRLDADDPTQVRALARELGAEVRRTMPRTQTTFERPNV